MLMNDLLGTKMFKLLSEPSQQVRNHEIQDAYRDFTEKIKITISKSEIDYSTVFRMLNMTRIELSFLNSTLQYEQGEKCLKRSLLAESYFCY